jgi:uncharacterized membrane protein
MTERTTPEHPGQTTIPSEVSIPAPRRSEPHGAEAPRARRSGRHKKVVRRPLGFAGLVGALALFCWSLTPSLLPRSWLLQGAVSGITAVIGYGFGSILGAALRRFSRWQPSAQMRTVGWRVLLTAGPALSLLFVGLGESWQRDVRRLMGMEQRTSWNNVLLVVLAVVVSALLLLVSRLVRLGTRGLVTLFDRWIPRPAAIVIGVAISVYLIAGFLQGFLFDNFVAVANRSASLENGRTAAGITQPASPYLSGSPASLVSWKSLGYEGRSFVGKAVPRAELARFTGKPAIDPIRVYVGSDGAGSAQAQAALAVRELERTGGFDRRVLAVMTSTGSGWVDQRAAASLEYMYGGDSALVSVQYSYLPSWISFLVDKSKATDAGKALNDAVHRKWSSLPPQSRPRLVVFGESLGSYGTETGYGELATLQSRVDGALFVGPPNANPIWRRVTADRDPGSSEWRPVYQQGRTVRFARTPADLRSPAGPWTAPRILYLENSSDPVVWWNPGLLFGAPSWLDKPRGPDVTGHMRYYPVVTFWQTAVDLVFSNGVPPGHGHKYGPNVVDGWATIAPPPGWTSQDTAALREIIAAVE